MRSLRETEAKRVGTGSGSRTSTGFRRAGYPERYAQDESAVAQVAEKALADYDAVFDVIETAISGDPFFMERGLTPLDYYITMLSEWHMDKTALFSARTKLARLCQAVNQNRSYRVTMDTHALQAE